MATNRNAPAWMIALVVVAGVALAVAGVVYLMEPAHSLPSFFPGHLAGSAHHHSKHGIAALMVAVALFVFAWISSGSKAAKV